MKKLLIAYYSWSNGNTERIARMLQKEVGGDLVKIDTTGGSELVTSQKEIDQWIQNVKETLV